MAWRFHSLIIHRKQKSGERSFLGGDDLCGGSLGITRDADLLYLDAAGTQRGIGSIWIIKEMIQITWAYYWGIIKKQIPSFDLFVSENCGCGAVFITSQADPVGGE